MASRYDADGNEAQFEPGSDGQVLRNKLDIRRVDEMEEAESEALKSVQRWAVAHYDSRHRFTAGDVCSLHRRWLGDIYPWAGSYRNVNMTKGGFPFAAAMQVPRLMQDFSRRELAQETPCVGMDDPRLTRALARTHAELILIHPFREGNGRCSRLLAYLMAIEAGLPSLDFSSFAGPGKRSYIAAIQAAVGGDYAPMQQRFATAIKQTLSAYGGLA